MLDQPFERLFWQLFPQVFFCRARFAAEALDRHQHVLSLQLTLDGQHVQKLIFSSAGESEKRPIELNRQIPGVSMRGTHPYFKNMGSGFQANWVKLGSGSEPKKWVPVGSRSELKKWVPGSNQNFFCADPCKYCKLCLQGMSSIGTKNVFLKSFRENYRFQLIQFLDEI